MGRGSVEQIPIGFIFRLLRGNDMNSKILLSPVLVIAMSLIGCQMMAGNQLSNADIAINKIKWKKSGVVFEQPSDNMLKANESRIVFIRQSETATETNPIVVGIGSDDLVGANLDNLFQVSLTNNHYSDVVICNGSQIITVQNMNSISAQVLAQSKRFDFIPQTTTYLKISLSAAGAPTIEKLPTTQALSLLSQSMRQTHQISRVFIDCSSPQPAVIPQPIVVMPLTVESPAPNLPIRNEKQFTVLFDFDSTKITTNTTAELGAMADFIKTRRTINKIILEGHTDNKGSDNYNLELSQARANKAKSILVNKYGVDSMKLTPMGYGEYKPVDTNTTRQGRRNNRRVVATVISEE